MKNYFTIREAADMVDMTPETLRHYDRIGLVKPVKRDEWSGYRYYSRQEIVRLNTIQALRCMDLSLAEIKRALEIDNLDEIVAFLKQAEQNANDKIAKLQYGIAKIRRARADYEKKLAGQQERRDIVTQEFPRRVILLSDTMQYPTLNNLWIYHSHFFDQIPEERRAQFSFEDLAGIYTAGEQSRLFAVCLQYPDLEGLTVLPAGTYLCANCSEESRELILKRLLQMAKDEYGVEPEFAVQLIVISGILQWNYQLQIYLGVS